MSAAGVEETSCSAILWLDVGPSGSGAPAMAAVTDLAAQPVGDLQVLINFTCSAAAGMLRPDTFNILSGSATLPATAGAGQLDAANPIATISGFPPDQEQYECIVAVAALPATLAVRPSAAGMAGPISGLVTAGGTNLPIPQLLQT
jgi:hypothetical protein